MVRSPLYAARILWRVPAGLRRAVRSVTRWAADWEAHPLRAASVRGEDTERYMKLAKQRDKRVRVRLMLLTVWSVSTVLTAFAVAGIEQPWLQGLAVVAVLVCLGIYGTPKDQPLVGRAVVAARYVKLTSDTVATALASISLGGIKDGSAIGFPSPITRDGPGWRADIDLPPGVTAAEVMERRTKLAAALSRPLGCVWPETAPDIHPGRLILWVADQDMSATRPPAWPLAKTGTGDLFAAMPIGTDPRGRWITATLMFTSVVIGALPRMGKTFSLRLLLLIAALDARAELYVFDLKGTGDLAALERVAHRYRAGDDEDDLLYILAALRELATEIRRRAKTIRTLPKDLCPENKITPHLANTKDLGLHPIVLGIDECQKLFEHPEQGKELEALCEDLVRRGPAVGIITVLATQRPDAKSLPTTISANAVLRLCLKVMGQTENDMVLGTSAYRNGLRATTFSFRDKGIGYLVGATDEPAILRTSYLDGPAADAVAIRARALREARGGLTGYAANDDPTTDTDSRRESSTLLTDLCAVFHPSELKVWSETLVDRLGDLRPDKYRAWANLDTGAAKAAQLAAALRPYGVSTAQVWGTDHATGKQANRRGVTYTDATAARDRLNHGHH
ncbi:cell division protein FtsK [Amycolatopsis minnesotensis]